MVHLSDRPDTHAEDTPGLKGPAYTDIVGGITTFFTMAYIVVVNPGILASPGTGMTFSGALTATVLVASSMTLLMGLYANVPIALASGMGLNAILAYQIAPQAGSWQVGVDWAKVFPCWFECLAATAEPDEYARQVLAVVDEIRECLITDCDEE